MKPHCLQEATKRWLAARLEYRKHERLEQLAGQEMPIYVFMNYETACNSLEETVKEIQKEQR